MAQQAIIPKTPDEVAASLSTMPEADQCIVKGVIIGLNEARQKIAALPPPGTARPSA